MMWVTGGGGFLGRALTSASERGDWELMQPPSKVLDVRDRERLLDQIGTWKPNVVVHLAYRRDDPRTIIDGSRNVAEAAASCGSRLIHLSTDLVFGGRPRPYVEADAPDAQIDYGRWKAHAEAVVAVAHPAALLLRTSLLYGTSHLAAPQLDVERAAGGAPFTFFTDEWRCPAHVDDVARAITVLADLPDVRGPLHLGGPEPVTRAQFAIATARWLGLDERALQVGPSPGGRPGHIVLDSSLAASLGIRCRSVAEAMGAS